MNKPQRSAGQERWLHFFNTVFYNAMAPIYNGLDVGTMGAWWRLVRRALDYVPEGGRVLEVGFGPGRLQVELAQRTKQCHGLDLATGMCRFTQRRLQQAGLTAQIVRGSVFELPYPTASFDSLVSTFAFSGLPNGDVAMKEMARVLLPGGRLVLVDIGLPSRGQRLGIWLAKLWERMGDFLYDQADMMERAGLKILSFEEFGPGEHIRAVVGIKP